MIRTICNEKGGVAKTTTAIQLAAGFANSGRKTLLIDGDPQGSATNTLFDDQKHLEVLKSDNTIAHVLTHPKEIVECIWKTGIPNLDIIPAKGDLNGTLHTLQNNPMTSYPARLKKALEQVDYDEIIIDNNPFFSLFTLNAIVCADEIILPTDIELGSIQSLQQTLEDIRSTLENLDDAKPLEYRILLTKLDRLNIDKNLEIELREMFGDHIYKTSIRTQRKPVKQASFSHTILIDDKKSNVAGDYRNFIHEVLGGAENE